MLDKSLKSVIYIIFTSVMETMSDKSLKNVSRKDKSSEKAHLMSTLE